MRILQNMLTALVSAPNRMRALALGQPADVASNPETAVEAVLSATGEVSSLVYAGTLLDQVEAMDGKALQDLLTHLAANYDIDSKALGEAAALYARSSDASGLARLTSLAEPRWMDLFRRLNATDGGTVRLVRLRERILKLTRDLPDAARIDAGLKSLLKMWFNPGFLILQPIDWSTPANILEKIIAYEAVHEISSWEDLRARLAPEDRRCFAFFHPSMPEEPLIFVEVALTDHTPGEIAPILRIDRETISGNSASTAVFYSISNCQSGLAGISFGNFLIKRVAQELKQEFPDLKRFVTLSPVPGLMRWLRVKEPELATLFLGGDDAFWKEEAADKEREFKAAALRYFLESDREDQLPNDPVARFHLGNGASLEQLNFAADLSEKGISQAGGMMVNYLYDLAVVEANHEAFNETKQVPLSAALRQLQRSLKS